MNLIIKKTLRLTPALLLVTLVACQGPSSDWTVWRGPNSNGMMPPQKWNPQALLNPANPLWKAEVGKGHSAVTVQGDRLYTLGAFQRIHGADTTFEDVVVCLDARTGQEHWHYSYPTQDRTYAGPRATPLWDDHRLYTLSWTGKLHCLDAQNGALIWKKDLVADSLSKQPTWGFAGSPIVDGKTLFLTSGARGLALDKVSGDVLWRSPNRKPGMASPVICTLNGRKTVIIPGADAFTGIDPATGDSLWAVTYSGYDDPIVMDNKIFFAGNRNGAKLYSIEADGPSEVWQSKGGSTSFQNFILHQGHAIGFGFVRRTQPLQCIDLSTGEIRWSEDLGLWGALCGVDDKLIILKNDGKVAVAQASLEGYQPLVEAQVLDMHNEPGLPPTRRRFAWTTPVLSHGLLYIRDSYGQLVCIDLTLNEEV